MNFRKLLSLIHYFTLGLYIYLLNNATDKLILNVIYIVSIQFALELCYCSYEYFKYYKPGKIFILKLRNYIFTTDSFVLCFILTALLISIIKNYKSIELNSIETLVFGFITSIRSGFFKNLKNDPRLDEESIMFNHVFSKDIFLSEIKSATLDTTKKSIELSLIDGSDRTIRLNLDFYEKEKDKLLNSFDLIENAV